MQAQVFYSWQSDISASECSTLITNALSASTRALVEDGTAQIVPVIDRDASNVPGAPDIGTTIFEKIQHADVFVADVTIIGRIAGRERPTPNPNVLIETGYALATLGPGRVLLVMNTMFGQPEQLPFDLRQRRTLTFETGTDDAEHAAAQRHLTSQLRDAIAPIIRERANTHAGDDSPQVARWRQLLEAAKPAQTRVEVDTSMAVDTRHTDVGGRPIAAPAKVDGTIAVFAVEAHTFKLCIPLSGGRMPCVTIPFSMVYDIWKGTEGRLHVALTRSIRIEDETTRLV